MNTGCWRPPDSIRSLSSGAAWSPGGFIGIVRITSVEPAQEFDVTTPDMTEHTELRPAFLGNFEVLRAFYGTAPAEHLLELAACSITLDRSGQRTSSCPSDAQGTPMRYRESMYSLDPGVR